MEKNVNLNYATDHVSQAKEADIKNTVTNGIRDAIPGNSPPAAVKQEGFSNEDDKATFKLLQPLFPVLLPCHILSSTICSKPP